MVVIHEHFMHCEQQWLDGKKSTIIIMNDDLLGLLRHYS
jgi:hypothetical protein